MPFILLLLTSAVNSCRSGHATRHAVGSTDKSQQGGRDRKSNFALDAGEGKLDGFSNKPCPTSARRGDTAELHNRARSCVALSGAPHRKLMAEFSLVSALKAVRQGRGTEEIKTIPDAQAFFAAFLKRV